MGTLDTANINLTGNFKGNQPRFKAHLDANRTTAGTGYVKWNHSSGFNGNYFTDVKFNIGGGYNSSDTTFTVPETGLYFWHHIMSTNGSAPAQAYTSCEYFIDGTRYFTGWQAQTSGYQIWQSTSIIPLTAGNVVEFGGEWQNTVTMQPRSFIAMYLLG